MADCMTLLKRFAVTLEKRYLSRVIRQSKKLRSRLTESVLYQALEKYLPSPHQHHRIFCCKLLLA
jgi:hypothetical protein